MYNKLKKFLKSKRAVGSVATAIKVGTACVLGAAVLVGGVALTNDVVLPNTSDKVNNVAEYEGGDSGGSTGGVTPVSVPVANPLLNPKGKIPEGGVYLRYSGTDAPMVISSGLSFPTVPSNLDVYVYGDYNYTYHETSPNGWWVSPKNKNKTSYGPILETINKKPVTSINETFRDCTALTTSPTIPDSVTDMSCAFYGCTSLATAPTIPDGVTNMNYTFYGCTSLTTAPTIPSSVTNMRHTFQSCSSLSGTITVNANPGRYDFCLEGTQISGVIGSTSYKEQILATRFQEDDEYGSGQHSG